MTIGDIVVYKGNKYQILWIYDNGQCEIKKADSLNEVVIASISELQIHKQKG